MEGRFDLHVHTGRSYDGKGTVLEIAHAARKAGLHGFAVTDHNEPTDPTGLREVMEKTGLLLVPGMELSTVDGHLLLYGVTEPFQKGADTVDVVEHVAGLGGVCVPAHPLRMVSGMGPSRLREHVEAGRFSLIEAVNGRDRPLVQENTRHLASDLGVGTIGGTDAHWVTDVGTAWTRLPWIPATVEEFLDALRHGDCWGEGGSLTRRKVIAHGLAVPGHAWKKRRQVRAEKQG